MIGSTLSFFSLDRSIIYGTGLMTSSAPLRGKPRRIISVRGPLTRKVLLQRGINCPEKYGDPALLLPLFYQPSISQTRTDIIDAITSSSFVISESLHGLIVAETYNIPSLWVEFVDHNTEKFNNEWSFKFLDFYESIGKHNMASIKLYKGFDFASLLRERNNWRPGIIDYHRLLEDFPFKIKPELLSAIKIPPMYRGE